MWLDAFSRQPNRVLLETEDGHQPMQLTGNVWQTGAAQLSLEPAGPMVRIWLEAPRSAVKRLHLSWHVPIQAGWRFLGDAWERGYGDLEWRGMVPHRVMPWYLLAWDGRQSIGLGVQTNPAAFAYFQVDGGGFHLTLDARCGGEGVQPGERRVELATLIAAAANETPFKFALDFCRQLSPAPRMPSVPVYGANDFYYAYGQNTAAQILEDTRAVVDLTADVANRPFSVIDSGWSNLPGESDVDTGIRTGGNERFPDMPGLAQQIKSLGAHPGIWVRPLVAPPGTNVSQLLKPSPSAIYARLPILDPSLAENLALVTADMRRLTEWGYDLIKHDFSTIDLLGRWGFQMADEFILPGWGFQMGGAITAPGWSFADRSRTTAEIIRAFYQAVRDGAGDALVIGCNTIGHLGAGLFELNRTGDDTSGRDWHRTLKMGVNTMAFRAAQHGAFFASDADCVGLTRNIPWKLNAQWLELVARSGTPLFVSAQRSALGPEQRHALSRGYAQASQPQPIAEPLDWLDTVYPARWRFGEELRTFDWYL